MKILIRGILAGLLFAVLSIGTASAQAPGNSLAAGYAANADKPINIEADSLEVNDQQKTATFMGNVTASQGEFTLKAKEIQVSYVPRDKKDGKASTAGAAGDSQITEINAKGKVLVTTKDNQTATSDWARFDVPAQLVTIGGSVVLTQDLNTITGDRLVIDLKTGVSQFKNLTETADGEKKPKQRLRAIFSPKSAQNPKN
ncbi:MAG: LPS ABC transporter substrate-binding protein LptA [Hyphomicrobiales bacterium]|nr:LPS ABC transporter substrate-binding protein LptA [Hyphomicrobiales bacterium]